MKPLPTAFTAALLTLGNLAAQAFGPLAQPPGPFQNYGPVSPAGSVERPKNSRTIIESDDGASFEAGNNTAEFSGHVKVTDSQFDLTCSKLHVELRPDHKGIQKVVASGDVAIIQEKTNDRGDVIKSIGKCGKATYDAVTGDVTMEEWPQIQQGINNQVATTRNTVMILNAKGKSRTIGGSRVMIVDQGGDHSVTP
jgi:lipopolysaccharide transport protein LptA